MWAMRDPRGPIENGTTYNVRPCMAPVNRLVSSRRISAGSCQLLVGPASTSRSEQMNVRSSTRATSGGSDRARKLFGRRSWFRRSNVPPSTSSFVCRSHSASDPSHHSTRSGSRTRAQRSTQSWSFWLVVVAAMILRGDVGSVSSVRGRVVSYREAFGIEPRRPHVDLRAQPQVCGATLAVQAEDHTLALAQLAEDGAAERIGGEIDLGEIGVPHDDPVPRPGVVHLDHALHRGLLAGLAAVGP